MKINLNQVVKIKLNSKGKEIFFHKDDWLREGVIRVKGHCPDYLKPVYPQEDDFGYSEFQLWELMKIYGSYLRMTDSPFEDTTIIYDEED